MTAPYEFDVVILTTRHTGTPHLAALAAANPGLVIHVHTASPAANDAGRLDAWRNCDRNLRDWWRENSATVTASRVLCLEWDVFCNVDLRLLMPPSHARSGMVCANLKTAVRDARSWPVFLESRRLPGNMRAWACGAVPFAVLLIDRLALDAISSAEWDTLFDADIFCELRTPTILRFLGMPVTACPDWTDVSTQTRAVPPGFRGLFHPAKTEVSE